MLRVAAILLWFCSTIASAAITVKLDRLSAPGWQLHAIDALVAPVVEAPGAFALTVSIRSIRAADVTLNDLTLRCANARLSPAAVECADGRLSIDGVEHCVSAAIDRERADLALRLRCAPGTLNVQSSSQDVALTAVGVSLKSLIELLPPALLAPLDAADGVLSASFRGESVDQLAGDIRWRDGTLRSSALGLEAEGMALDCRVRDLGANCAIAGGTALWGDALIEWPAAPISTIDIAPIKTGWRARYRDPIGVAVDVEQIARERTLSLDVQALDTALDRYAQSALSAAGWDGLRASGAVESTFRWRNEALSTWTLSARNLAASIGTSSAREVTVSLDWQRGQPGRPGRLRAEQVIAAGVPIGAVSLAWRTRDTGAELTEPSTLALLGGSVQLQHARFDARERSLAAAVSLRQINLNTLTAAFDLPSAEGQLDGRFDPVLWREDRLELTGTATARAFDGAIVVRDPVLERPFSAAPSIELSATVESLDLSALTAPLALGEVRGRLDGRVDDLRLLAGEPVQFDLSLRTASGPSIDRVISQRAVSSLSSIGGGGGAAGALQSGVLKLFKSFRYDQIGIDLKLARNVCLIDGIAPAGAGYLLMRGRGIPRVDVVGFERRVNYPLLRDRLKAALGGQAPVIQSAADGEQK